MTGWARIYLALWASTIAGAAITAAIPGLAALIRDELGLALAAHRGDLGYLAAIAAHNLAACGWGLALPAAGGWRTPAHRAASTIALGVWAAANTLPVGAAIAVHHTQLYPYLAHLPVEWAALTVPVALNRSAARRALERRDYQTAAVLLGALVLAAATTETYLTPHT